jgi:hypothetical protein
MLSHIARSKSRAVRGGDGMLHRISVISVPASVLRIAGTG